MHVLVGRAAPEAQDALPRRRRPRNARVLRTELGEVEARDPASWPAPPFGRARHAARGRTRLAFLAASLALHLALFAWARAGTSARAPVLVLVPIAWVDAEEAPPAVAPDPAPPPPASPRPARRAAPVRRPPIAPAAPVPAASDEGLPSVAPEREATAPVSGGAGASAAPGGASEPIAASIALPRGGYQVRPAYPARARAAGAEGTTRVRVLVTPRGRVAEARVEESAGDADLDRAALGAVRRWRFDPLALPPEAPGLWVIVPIQFQLSEER